MRSSSKILIIAPFWGRQGHVGNYRVERFIRWMASRDAEIVVVRAGSRENVEKKAYSTEITVKDPLGLYRDGNSQRGDHIPPSKLNKVRRSIAYLLFNPDPTVVWARYATNNAHVLHYGRSARWVLSSSPPESAHVASAAIAKRLGAELIVDLRDGWLDEPLKPLLRHSRLQRWREGKLETRLLKQARQILVTSSNWKTLLEERLPLTQDKTTVLTNAYPPEQMISRMMPFHARKTPGEPVRLVHAGRFSGSEGTRRVQNLLEPLVPALRNGPHGGVITLLGTLKREDELDVARWRGDFNRFGWSIEIKEPVPRDEMMHILNESDGFLLLCVSQAAIPSKLFEYIPMRKPIFAVTPKGSAVWKIGEAVPQMFLADYAKLESTSSSVRFFLKACADSKVNYLVPEEFSEKRISEIFLSLVFGRSASQGTTKHTS